MEGYCKHGTQEGLRIVYVPLINENLEFKNTSSASSLTRVHHVAFTGVNGAATNNILVDYTLYWEYIPDARQSRKFEYRGSQIASNEFMKHPQIKQALEDS